MWLFQSTNKEPKPPHHSINFVYIRHGQSRAQLVTHSGDRHNDPTLNDCTLSPYGEEQAVTLGKRYGMKDKQALSVGLIVVSPLMRALQTACIVLSSGMLQQATGGKEMDFRIIVNPLLAEHGDIPENKGRPVERLKQSEFLNKHACFEKFDFSLCEEMNWPSTHTPNKSLIAKTKDFTKWLNENYPEGEERLVYIFGHKDFGTEFMEMFWGMKNCSPINGRADYTAKGKGKVKATS